MISDKNDMTLPPWERGLRQGGLVNEEVMKKNLLDFKSVMDLHEVPFVAIFGTLLAFVREQRVIPTSKDADFMCYAPDHLKMKPVVEELESMGFTVVDRNESPLNDGFYIRDGEKIEIWWYSKIGNQYVYDNQIRYDAKYFDNLKDIEVYGANWKIPVDSEENLDITYGKDWRTPNPKGTYILDASEG